MELEQAFEKYQLPATVLLDYSTYRRITSQLPEPVEEIPQDTFEYLVRNNQSGLSEYLARFYHQLPDFLAGDHPYVRYLRTDYEEYLHELEIEKAQGMTVEQPASFFEFVTRETNRYTDNYREKCILVGLIYGIDFRRYFNAGSNLQLTPIQFDRILAETQSYFQGTYEPLDVPEEAWKKMWEEIAQ